MEAEERQNRKHGQGRLVDARSGDSGAGPRRGEVRSGRMGVHLHARLPRGGLCLRHASGVYRRRLRRARVIYENRALAQSRRKAGGIHPGIHSPQGGVRLEGFVELRQPCGSSQKGNRRLHQVVSVAQLVHARPDRGRTAPGRKPDTPAGGLLRLCRKGRCSANPPRSTRRKEAG